jgi:hypothetical protein
VVVVAVVDDEVVADAMFNAVEFDTGVVEAVVGCD